MISLLFLTASLSASLFIVGWYDRMAKQERYAYYRARYKTRKRKR